MVYIGANINAPRYENGSTSIMGDAVYDTELKWNEDQINVINACCLFHGALYLSDMMDYSKQYITKE